MNLFTFLLLLAAVVFVASFLYGFFTPLPSNEPEEEIPEEEEGPEVVYETLADLCRFFKREGEITYAADVNFMQKKAEAGEVDIDTAALFLDYASQTVKESVRYADERNATYRNAVDKAFREAAGRLLDAMDGEE